MSVDQKEIAGYSLVDLIPSSITFAEQIQLQTIVLSDGRSICVWHERVDGILRLVDRSKLKPNNLEGVLEFFESLQGEERSLLDSICNDKDHTPITTFHAAQLWLNAYSLINKEEFKE